MIQIAIQIGSITSAASRVGVKLLRGAIASLLSAYDPNEEEDALNSAIRGGDFNFRTSRFDDGTDPAGWYGRD